MPDKVSIKNTTLAELLESIEEIEQQLEDLPTPVNNSKKWLRNSRGQDQSCSEFYL